MSGRRLLILLTESLCTMLYALTTTNINVVLRQPQGTLSAVPDFEPIPKYRTVGSDLAKVSRGKNFVPVGLVFRRVDIVWNAHPRLLRAGIDVRIGFQRRGVV